MNVKISKWNPLQSDRCSFCNIEAETVAHLFFEWPEVSKIWKAFSKWLEKKHEIKLSLNLEMITCCNLENIPHAALLNTVILIIKHYIYATKCKQENLSFIGALTRVINF